MVVIVAAIEAMEMAEEPHLEKVADLLLSIQASFVKDARNQVTKNKTVQSDAIIARRSIMSLTTVSNFNGIIHNVHLNKRIAMGNTIPHLNVTILGEVPTISKHC